MGLSRTVSVSWGNITGSLPNQIDLQSALDGKSPNTHTHDTRYSQLGHIHTIADNTGLQSALDAKADLTYVNSLAFGGGGGTTNASALTTGTLPVGRLPAFTGDVTSSAGSNVLTINGFTKIVADRTTLANLSIFYASAYLKETNREGIFVWNGSNLSAFVSADTTQGIYVAPTSDTSGASGAWVRHFSGSLDIRWFGAVADCTAVGVGTDNTAAFNSAKAVGVLLGKSHEILIPKAALGYRVASTLTFTNGTKLRGQGWHENPGNVGGTIYTAPQNWRGSILVFDQNVAGLQFIDFTDNNANSQAFEFEGSRYSIVEDLALYGGAGTTVTAHGIESRTVLTMRHVRVENFAGNGLKIDAYTSGANPYGNASKSRFDNCIFNSNKCHGAYVIGTDSNIMLFTGCDFSNNGGAGYIDFTTVGNNVLNACHFATNNQSFGAGTAATTQVQSDSSLLATQVNGSILLINSASTPHVLVGIYIESGNGSKAHVPQGTLILGGVLGQGGSALLEGTSYRVGFDGFGSLYADSVTPSSGGWVVNHASGGSGDYVCVGGGVAKVRMLPGSGLFSNIQMLGNANSSANGMDLLAGNGGGYLSANLFQFRNAAQTTNFFTHDGSNFNIQTGAFQIGARTVADSAGKLATTVVDRTALSNLPTAFVRAYLTEAGREGEFVWNGGANVQTLVTADTAQGIYVAPAGGNGSTGAWVRRFNTTWDIRWFGALANDQSNSGTDALPAINAMLSIYAALGIGTNKPFSVIVDFPGYYFVNGFINLKNSIHMRWPGSFGMGGAQGASRMRFPASTGGIVVNGPDTTGYTATAVASTTGAPGTILERPYLQGGGGTYTDAADGILVRSRCDIIDPYIDGFARNGISVYADNGNNPMWGNASGTHIRGGRLVNNGNHGIHLKGSDANEVHVIGVDCTLNGAWGKLDESFLGCVIIGGLDESNGAATYVDYPAAGQIYFCRYGQESAASTTQPGTNSAVWFPFPGLSGGGYPTWTNGGTYRSGGSFRLGSSVALRPYVEGGQGYADAGSSGLILGGLLGAAGQDYFGAFHNGTFGQHGLNGGFKSNARSWMVGSELFFDGTASVAYPGGLGGQFAGAIYWNNSDGLVTYGYGSAYDYNILNKNGNRVFSIPTGLTRADFGGDVNLTAGALLKGATTLINSSGVLQAAAFPALTGDVTTTAGSLATTIAANAVTYAKFQTVAANSLVGNPTGSTATAQGITLAGGLTFSGTTLTAAGALTPTSIASTGAVTSSSASGGIGYATGAGGTVTQATSRTTGVTLNKTTGAITLVSAAGSTTFNTFTVTNSSVAATDTVIVNQKSGTDKYQIFVTAVAAGSFAITFATTGGTTTEQPVFNFSVLKGVAA